MCEITGVCHITGFYAVVSGVVCVKQPVFVILPDFMQWCLVLYV